METSSLNRLLQDRLNALIDLQLTLKHIHWNVVGPQFQSIHELMDQQVEGARTMTDDVAERIATLGGQPEGTPGAVVRGRRWDDYPLRRDVASQHLDALCAVYEGIIDDHRRAIADTEQLDPVTQDLLITQTGELEQYQWMVRAHLEAADGSRARTGGWADRPPTEQEERDAERAAADVDVREVGEHYGEMAKVGANLEGEGAIEGSPRR